MTISPVLFGLTAILAFILILAIPTWLFLRQEAMRTGVTEARHEIGLMKVDYTRILQENANLAIKIADAIAQVEAAKARDASTQETIRALNNKLNSRERVDKKNREKADREEEEQNAESQGGELPLFTPQAAPLPSLKRKFGVV